jgi:2-polyprenyl-6-methoxyphenol hydroxylase-like FAD-dependent oxidoreductase
MARALGEHAVVVGGGIAGLLAAQVLADHFERITVVERDSVEESGGLRPGTPQAWHAHALLQAGRNALAEICPGFEPSLVRAGAALVDWGRDFAVHSPLGWMPREPTGLETLACSRAFLEGHLRAWIAAERTVARIRFLQAEVTGLRIRDAHDVAGVVVRDRSRGSRRTDLDADLVVDASGRASRAPDWLAEAGYPRPRETVVRSLRGYATRWYERPARAPGWSALLQSTWAPGNKRGGLVYPIEDSKWIVMLVGADGEYPPLQPDAFLSYARFQVVPDLHDAIRHARPIGAIRGFRSTENRLRHFEATARWPERFVALGDSVCALNPVHAQGMTCAALSAVALRRLLRTARPGEAGLSRAAQRCVLAAVTPAWLFATCEDLRWASTTGAKAVLATHWAQHVLDGAQRAAARGPDANRLYLEAWHLLRPIASLVLPQRRQRTSFQVSSSFGAT